MSAAATAEYDNSFSAADDDSRSPLPLRGDTFLGVCEAIGQDFGFHANWLRVPFAALILWNPAVVVGAYLGLGGIVALSRWLYPAPRPVATSNPASESEPEAGEQVGQNEEELAFAA